MATSNPSMQDNFLKDHGWEGDNDGSAALRILKHLVATQTVAGDVIRQAIRDIQSSSNVGKVANETKKASKSQDQSNNNKSQTESSFQGDPIRRRHIALHVYYDGEKYSGLAENVGKEDDRSIERSLFTALERTNLIQAGPNGESPRSYSQYSRCGRTDRGVSAAGQVVALKLKSGFSPATSWDEEGHKILKDWELPRHSSQSLTVYCPPRKKKASKKKKKNKSAQNMDHDVERANDNTQPQKRIRREMTELQYDKILNNVLPPEIRVLGWTPVSTEFSARFSATTRTYRYFFSSLLLDLDRMQSALSLLVGEHDFRNFCKMDVEHVYNFVRKIHYARIHIVQEDGSVVQCEGGDEDKPSSAINMGKRQICYFEIHGQAFLWHQIRCIVSIMFLVGRGLEEPSIVTELLNINKYPGKPAYELANEVPLVLHHCGFTNLQLGYSMSNLWNVCCHMEKQKEEHLLAAARIQNGINRLGEDAIVHVKDVQDFGVSRLSERQKKAQKYGGASAAATFRDKIEEARNASFGNAATISWKQALDWMHAKLSLVPDPANVKDMVHIPISKRSMGTTYDEKVASIQQSSKRKSRYEENVISKRRSREEDKAFYDHMAKQGSTS